jgi:hypothetical protein
MTKEELLTALEDEFKSGLIIQPANGVILLITIGLDIIKCVFDESTSNDVIDFSEGMSKTKLIKGEPKQIIDLKIQFSNLEFLKKDQDVNQIEMKKIFSARVKKYIPNPFFNKEGIINIIKNRNCFIG